MIIMTITIGERTVETKRPQDLDERLLAKTGCNAIEMQRMLQGSPTAGLVATALAPFLAGDPPVLAELAVEIAKAGPAAVAVQVATLYAAPLIVETASALTLAKPNVE
jgi:hypothetical protein